MTKIEIVPNLSMITCVDRGNGIGIRNNLPWQGLLKSDMAHFIKTTKEGVVVMGRKTYQSIPEEFLPLRNRENIVLTRDEQFHAPGCQILFSVEQVLYFAQHQTSKEVWIIGGAEIYELFWPHARRLVVTHVEARLPCDTFFPFISPVEWESRLMFTQPENDDNKFPFITVEYVRQ